MRIQIRVIILGAKIFSVYLCAAILPYKIAGIHLDGGSAVTSEASTICGVLNTK